METNNFDIALLLSMKIINFFHVVDVICTICLGALIRISEAKHGFDWEHVTRVMSNKIG